MPPVFPTRPFSAAYRRASSNIPHVRASFAIAIEPSCGFTGNLPARVPPQFAANFQATHCRNCRNSPHNSRASRRNSLPPSLLHRLLGLGSFLSCSPDFWLSPPNPLPLVAPGFLEAFSLCTAPVGRLLFRLRKPFSRSFLEPLLKPGLLLAHEPFLRLYRGFPPRRLSESNELKRYCGKGF